jgi:hypothetical protein
VAIPETDVPFCKRYMPNRPLAGPPDGFAWPTNCQLLKTPGADPADVAPDVLFGAAAELLPSGAAFAAFGCRTFYF